MNRDGSVVRYLALAHNERHPRTGSPVAKVIHNFGRADKVDREALGRLVASISRFLEPEQAVAAAAGTEGEILDAPRPGGAGTLDRLWERLGIGAAIRRAADGRQLDGEQVERVIFALVAQRALEPGPIGQRHRRAHEGEESAPSGLVADCQRPDPLIVLCSPAPL